MWSYHMTQDFTLGLKLREIKHSNIKFLHDCSYQHTMKYFTAVKSSEVLIDAITCISLKTLC